MHLSIGQASTLLGVSVSTLRRWEREGFSIPAFRTCGGHRRFALVTLESLFLESQQETPITNRVIAYAKVSSHDQKKDLETQKERLEAYCRQNFLDYEIISDLGSGLNYRKPGLRKLLRSIFLRQTQHLILNHKDRLLRFGSEIIFDLCKHFGVKVTILEKREDLKFEDELAADVIVSGNVCSRTSQGARVASSAVGVMANEQRSHPINAVRFWNRRSLMTVFSSRLYGKRSHANRKNAAAA